MNFRRQSIRKKRNNEANGCLPYEESGPVQKGLVLLASSALAILHPPTTSMKQLMVSFRGGHFNMYSEPGGGGGGGLSSSSSTLLILLSD